MDIDFVLSGGGMLFPCHLGVYSYLLEQGVKVRRVAGTSCGSIVAAGIAHGWTVEQAMELAAEVTTRDILDKNWMPWRGMGLFKGDVIHDILRENLPGRMRDSEIPWGAFVSDVWKRQGTFVTSGHLSSSIPTMMGYDLPSADVVRASCAIPFWFKQTLLKGRPQVDGGTTLNFGMGVWKDSEHLASVKPRPTIGVRFKSNVGQEKRTSGVIDNVGAVLSMLTDNANHTYVDKDQWPYVIEIQSEGDSMDFNADVDWLQRRFDEGVKAAEDRWPSIKELCDVF